MGEQECYDLSKTYLPVYIIGLISIQTLINVIQKSDTSFLFKTIRIDIIN